MLSCEKITELCSQEMERDLKLGEKVSLSTHLMMCSGCTNFRKQMRFLRLAARAYAHGGAASLPPEDEPPTAS